MKNLSALTEAECNVLLTKRVFVAGCGGLGGHVTDMLLRLGVGEIRVADGDRFELSNLNRQLFSNMESLGQSKAKAAAAWAERVNPGLRFFSSDCFIDEENASALIRGCDAVLDALDSVPARRILAAECQRQGIPYVHGAVRAWVAQAAVTRSPVRFLKSLYSCDAPAEDESAPVFTPAMCASMQVALCVRLLCGKDVDWDRLYLFDLSSFDFGAV